MASPLPPFTQRWLEQRHSTMNPLCSFQATVTEVFQTKLFFGMPMGLLLSTSTKYFVTPCSQKELISNLVLKTINFLSFI